MTLNIVLVGSRAIYVCSDYRLSDLNGRPVLERGHKVLSTPSVPALVTFTGTAETGRGRVGDWIASKIPALGEFDVTVDQVIERLRTADDWLRHRRRDGTRRLSLAVVAWKSGRPFVALISNFQDGSGRILDEIQPRLQVYIIRRRVLVTGMQQVIKGPERRRLEHLADLPTLRVFDLLAETNRLGSSRAGDKLVSSSCAVAQLEATGRSSGRPYDTEPFENIPPETQRMLRASGHRIIGPGGGPARVVQWASSAPPPPLEEQGEG